MFVVAFLDPAASAGWFTGAVTGAAQDAGENIGHPVDHVGIGITPLANQADVFRYGGVGGASVLAIDNFVEVVGIGDIGRQQIESP